MAENDVDWGAGYADTASLSRPVFDHMRATAIERGPRGAAYVWHLLIPAALPPILSGLKIGWAFAWRTLIAAALVFGVSARSGGLGWFIFKHRNERFTDRVFAGPAAVVIIGPIVEAGIFRTIERLTVRRWCMHW